ncbi:MAG TPA: carboxylesterase family protein [Ramlibacter sp.]|nr:carboxylesterase family protein [Ramlibacter sp.]
MTLCTYVKAALAALVILQAAGCGGGGGSAPPAPDGGGSAPPSAMQRATTYGPVVGTDDTAATGTYQWKGGPFAKAPAGNLRWMPPVDPDPWTEARPAQTFASACAQSGRLYGPGQNNRYDATIATALGTTVGSEDCLYLNIWAPATAATSPRAVIVWVHGGSNITGYTADPVYDGAKLAKTADVVVVSVNYRLGVLGFLNAAPLKTGDPLVDSGNFALLDLVKALKFVQGNIAAFGGNPGNVTLMGQSAGAVNVLALQTSPVVRASTPQLFHRLVEVSGGISTPATVPPGVIATIYPAAVWAQQGATLLEYALVNDGTVPDLAAAATHVAGRTAAENAAYLRSKSPDALLSIVRTQLPAVGLQNSNPIPDGNVLPLDPIMEIRAGRYLKVPVLAGITRDETKLFPSLFTIMGLPSGRLLTDAQVFNMAFSYNANAAPATTLAEWIPAQYLPVTAPGTGFNFWADILNQFWFIPGRNDLLNSLQMQQTHIWHYQFDWDEQPAPFNDIFGAAHAFDLPFLFGNFGPSLYANFTNSEANRPGREQLADAMMKSLGAFARSGDPNNASLGVRWNQWPHKVVFDADLNTKQITAQ